MTPLSSLSLSASSSSSSSSSTSAEDQKIKEFEALYREEYKAYLAENKSGDHDIWNTMKKYPGKHLLLVFLWSKSLLVMQECVLRFPAGERRWLSTLLCFMVGYYLADFSTGLVHMMGDNTQLSLTTTQNGRPFLEWVAYGFHHHHAHPLDWNYNNIYFAAIIRAGSSFYIPVTVLTLILVPNNHVYLKLSLLICSHTGMFVQFAHAACHGRWASATKNNKHHTIISSVLQCLQTMGLLIHPTVHKEHHKLFDRNYAILNGWSNPLLNTIYNWWIRPNVHPSVSPETQRLLYYQKQVPILSTTSTSTTTIINSSMNKDNDQNIMRKVPLERPFFILFPEWRKHHNYAV